MHVGLIPDGNRRWARERGLSVRQGHEAGARTLEAVLRYAVKNRGVREISIYSLSTENLASRPQSELRDIFEIQAEYFERFSRDPVVHEERVRGRLLGFREMLPTNVLGAAMRMEEATEGHSQCFVNFLMPYGGQQEIVSAAQRMVLPPYGPLALFSPHSGFEDNLFVNNPVDLVIRTAERRLSNFLPYQTAYAEYVFVDKYWPSFTTGDFDGCLEEFANRVRRRGE